MIQPGSAVESLLAGLIDYAGLYPPAGLDMGSAVRNYLEYRKGPYRRMLGRFVVNLDRLGDLRHAAAESFADLQLSVIVSSGTDFRFLTEVQGDALDRVAFECKVAEPWQINQIVARLPGDAECYFEVPMTSSVEPLLDAIAAHGARAKLRMGGVMSEAFPSPRTVACMLQALADRGLPFKATAGLHHAVRSRHPFTYKPESREGVMHGFLNVICAAAVLHFGGTEGEALDILNQEDPRAWQVTPEAICWRAFRWSTDQLCAVRKHFFISFGSCSFEEPICDLEAMGWL